jgi:hypothetical protein
VCALHFDGTEKVRSDRLEDKTTKECISYSTMNPFPCQCIEICGQCGHKRLPLARLHLRNAPIMQHGATNYLRQIQQPRNRNSIIRTTRAFPIQPCAAQAKLGTCTSKCCIPSILLADSRTTANASATQKEAPCPSGDSRPK